MTEPGIAEGFQRAATWLATLMRARGWNSVCVASMVSGQGATTTSVAIAHGLEELGLRTLLIEACPPSVNCGVADMFGLDKSRSLLSIAIEKHTPQECFQRTLGGVTVLPWGIEEDERESGDIGVTLKQTITAATEYDVVLVEAPPLKAPQAITILAALRRVVLVVGAGSTESTDLRMLRRYMSRHEVEIVGAVFNKVRSPIPRLLDNALFGSRVN